MKKQEKDLLIKITPVGGVGQIGSNMALITSQSSQILIDAGILFPYEEFFDINYLIPDLEELKKKANPTDIVITHGHEDHIGAITHVVKEFPKIKIWAPAFAAALIRSKFDYKDISHKVHIYEEKTELKFKDFIIHPILVNHSIPDTHGLLIQDKKKEASLFYVSDFKYDDKSPYEKPMNLKKLNDLSKDSKLKVMLSDSTNITSSVLKTPSEADLIKDLEKIIQNAKSRVFVTCFSSNIHRIQTLINIASETKRKVVLYGRSMVKYSQIALEEGFLNDPNAVLKESRSVTDNDENIIVVASGCQGDFRGTLRRLATDTDSIFKIRHKDTIVFSSKNIPGSEKKVFLLINQFCEKGCSIYTDRDALIHASGHPGKEDLRYIYNSFKPTHIVPIHGETLFLKRHEEFIQEEFPHITSLLMSNYDSLVINKNGNITTIPSEAASPILIHGNMLEIEREVISQRRKMACNGMLFISIEWNSLKTRNPSFDFSFDGLPREVTDRQEEFDQLLTEKLLSLPRKRAKKEIEDLRIFLRRYFQNIIGYKPLVRIHVV